MNQWVFTNDGELDDYIPRRASAEIDPTPVESFICIHHVV